MTCKVIQTECLAVGDRVPITIDFSMVAANKWRRGAIFAATDRIRASKSGYEYEATTAGQTGDREPIWPRTLDATVEDGSVVWTAKAVSVASLLKTISTVTWTPPTGVTISGETKDTTTQVAQAYVEPTVAGTHEIEITVAFDDTPAQEETFILVIEAE